MSSQSNSVGLVRRRMLLALAALASGLTGTARAATLLQARPTAQAYLDAERALAAAESKGVLVVFFASWCAWCRLLDRLLADPAATELLSSRFRVVHMRIRERQPAMLAMQLAGADELLSRLGGAPRTGVPFFAFLDAQGAVLANSIANGANIGFPTANSELAALDAIIRRVAPDASVTDRTRLLDACVRLAPT